MSNFWPGSNIVKSKNNSFNWKTKKTALTSHKDWKQSVDGTYNASLKKTSITVYSRAKPSK